MKCSRLFFLLVQWHIHVGCNHTSEKLIRGFYQCGAWEVSEPLAESANGRRGVGIKVDVGEQNSSCLCWITQLYISLWLQLSGHRCSWDHCSEVWNLIPFGGMLQFSGPALQWKWANCLNPLIKSSILLACNSQWKHLGSGKEPICPVPPSSGLGEVTHHLNLQSHML